MLGVLGGGVREGGGVRDDLTRFILGAVHDALRARKITTIPIEALDHLLAACDLLQGEETK